MTSRVRRNGAEPQMPRVHGLERSTVSMFYKAEGSTMFASRWINAGYSAVQWVNNAGEVVLWT